VSVVIPTFNAQQYLAATVESVRAQLFDDWEVVVYDDGSRDQTLSLARVAASGDPRVRVIAGEHGGTARARNRGFAETDEGSEFVIFLDHDDIWERDALLLLTRTLEDHPDSPAAHGLAQAIGPLGDRFPDDDLAASMASRWVLRYGHLTELLTGGPTTFEALVVKNYPVTPGTTLIRRRVRQEVGGYAPETVPCDDWDMNLRVARRGGIALANRVVLNWRRHPGAASHTTRRWRQAYLTVRRRSVLSAENSQQQRAAAKAAFRLACRDAWRDLTRQAANGHLVDSSRALTRWLLFEAAYWQTTMQAERGEAVRLPPLGATPRPLLLHRRRRG
jgi:glycosyltransferase involved in cell wall biosynthesis